jgi:3-oxoacyl-[acyl-carrier protein] reductase
MKSAAMAFSSTMCAQAEETSLGRIGDPKELANLVAFLASGKASYMTGTTIRVDGGLVRAVM